MLIFNGLGYMQRRKNKKQINAHVVKSDGQQILNNKVIINIVVIIDFH